MSGLYFGSGLFRAITIVVFALACAGCGRKEPDYTEKKRPFDRGAIEQQTQLRLQVHQSRAWQKIDTSGAVSLIGIPPRVDIYIDPKSVQRHRLGRAAWTRWEYSAPEESRHIKEKYLSKAVMIVADCAKNESGDLDEDLYAENNLSGKVVGNLTSDAVDRGVVYKEARLRMHMYIEGGLAQKVSGAICQLELAD